MKARDQRLLLLMKNVIDGYLSGQVTVDLNSFNSFIVGLEALLEMLEDVNPGWVEEFHTNWGAIEVAYAVGLDRGQPPEKVAAQKEVIESIERMKTMIEKIIELEITKPLIRALHDESVIVQDSVITALENIGKPCLPLLKEALKREKNKEVKETLELVICDIERE